MTTIEQNGKATLAAVQTAVESHGTTRDELIPILSDVNRKVGYLPAEALDEVSRLMHVPKSQVFSVATFYHMLSTEKLGDTSSSSARARRATWWAGGRSGRRCRKPSIWSPVKPPRW